jgi:hypothetical protein
MKKRVFATRGTQGVRTVRRGVFPAQQATTKIGRTTGSAEAVLLESSPLLLAQPQVSNANDVPNFLFRV